MSHRINKLVSIINTLRGKNGCPWDKKQNFKSIREHVLEESYEVIESINLKDYNKLKEELGDLLIQIIFLSRLAEEKNYFNINDVIETASDKLIRRHPHIFGNIKVRSTKQVLRNWERIKKSENSDKKYILDDIPNYLPALLKAKKVQNKVSRFGFDWKRIDGPVKKLKEELSEFIEAIKSKKKNEIEDELGDILFTVVNIARFYSINPEEALNKTIKKFIKRFNFIEDSLSKKGRNISESSLSEMEHFWNQSKLV